MFVRMEIVVWNEMKDSQAEEQVRGGNLGDIQRCEHRQRTMRLSERYQQADERQD